ncbi:MAG TPA: hypothetical protein VGO09_10215, partial [Flavisolibacter sp.]|nr:hypothetical protein [Flavisolibacter sp.]
MELLKTNQVPTNRKKSGTAFHVIQKVVNKYWYLFLLCLLISVGIAFWINRNTMPLYLVRTSLLVKEAKNISNNPQNLLYGEAEELKSTRSNIPEEIALLESFHFIRRTIDSMHMQLAYFGGGRFQQQELYKVSPFKISFPDSGSITKLYGSDFSLVFTDMNHVRIEQLSDNKPVQGKVYALKQNINVNGCPLLISATSNFIASQDIGRIFQFKVYEPEALTWEFKNNLNILANGLDGSIIRVYLATTVPEKGIDFLNEFTRQYLNYKYEEKIRAVSQSMAFIDGQL